MNKMLPDLTKPSTSSTKSRRNNTVFINPNFKAAAPHINPKFIISPQQQPIIKVSEQSIIHINPQFLQSVNERSVQDVFSDSQMTLEDKCILENKVEAKIISKSKTKLVRQPQLPVKISFNQTPSEPLGKKPILTVDQVKSTSLAKIGHRKLIRSSNITNSNKHLENYQNTKLIPNVLNSTSNLKDKYKIDRRIRKKSLTDEKKKISYHTRYALRRTIGSPIKKGFVSKRKIIRSSLKIDSISTKKNVYLKTSVHKKLELLNINGVLYKSTRNKLQRNDAIANDNKKPNLKPHSINMNKDNSKNIKKSNGDRTLFVRGNKFILDKNGFKLTRCTSDISTSSLTLLSEKAKNFKRIDIGGLTYIAKNNNVFIRTDTHVTRNHLSTAKNKSINVLTNRLVKSNIPCQIYRKLGKCSAFENGKCPKIHDKSQISICIKFLKGECNNMNCFLSHNISLSKMPVCKFFLQGLCSREDCPYLHKKLSKGAKICLDFLKGYCKLAEKCNKRHEYLCPDYISKGKCDKIKCLYCLKRDSLNKLINNKSIKIIKNNNDNRIIENENNNISDENATDKSIISRYFLDDSSNDSNNDSSNDSNESENTKKNDKINFENNVQESSDSDDNSGDNNCTGMTSGILSNRPKLGSLPAFIPL